MLILDSHVTHTNNLAATDMAREAGVVTPHNSPIPTFGWGLFRTVCKLCFEDVDERTCRQTSGNMASRRNS